MSWKTVLTCINEKKATITPKQHADVVSSPSRRVGKDCTQCWDFILRLAFSNSLNLQMLPYLMIGGLSPSEVIVVHGWEIIMYK